MTDFSKLPPECDELCRWRKCLHKGENKGPYTPGRGYTSYFDKPEYVCMTRMQHGCGDNREGLKSVDTKKMIQHFQDKIDDVTASKKVKSIMLNMLWIIKLLTERSIKCPEFPGMNIS